MSDFDDELTIANKLLGVTVRRAPINFVGEIKTKEDKKLVREKVKHERKARVKKYAGETPEEKKKRLSEAAKAWYYAKVAADPSYKEKRRQDAKKWKKKPTEEPNE